MDGRFSFKSATIKRTLRGFSKDLSGERMYDLYNAYYGSTTYADDWVTAALDGTGEFVGKPDIVREEAALKGTAYGNVWMYVLHELEVAILDITKRDDEESAIKHASINLADLFQLPPAVLPYRAAWPREAVPRRFCSL